MFFDNYKNNKILTREEELEYFKLYKESKNENIRNLLISCNMRLVFFIANKYKNIDELDDIVSVGTIGLMKAIDGFDYTKGVKFSTYASTSISNAIFMEYRKTKGLQNTFVRLEDIISKDSEGGCLHMLDILKDKDINIEENFLRDESLKKLSEYVENLDCDDRYLIEYLFGLNGRPKLSQNVVASKFNISQSYICRKKIKLLKAMKEDLLDII